MDLPAFRSVSNGSSPLQPASARLQRLHIAAGELELRIQKAALDVFESPQPADQFISGLAEEEEILWKEFRGLIPLINPDDSLILNVKQKLTNIDSRIHWFQVCLARIKEDSNIHLLPDFEVPFPDDTVRSWNLSHVVTIADELENELATSGSVAKPRTQIYQEAEQCEKTLLKALSYSGVDDSAELSELRDLLYRLVVIKQGAARANVSQAPSFQSPVLDPNSVPFIGAFKNLSREIEQYSKYREGVSPNLYDFKNDLSHFHKKLAGVYEKTPYESRRDWDQHLAEVKKALDDLQDRYLVSLMLYSPAMNACLNASYAIKKLAEQTTVENAGAQFEAAMQCVAKAEGALHQARTYDNPLIVQLATQGLARARTELSRLESVIAREGFGSQLIKFQAFTSRNGDPAQVSAFGKRLGSLSPAELGSLLGDADFVTMIENIPSLQPMLTALIPFNKFRLLLANPAKRETPESRTELAYAQLNASVAMNQLKKTHPILSQVIDYIIIQDRLSLINQASSSGRKWLIMQTIFSEHPNKIPFSWLSAAGQSEFKLAFKEVASRLKSAESLSESEQTVRKKLSKGNRLGKSDLPGLKDLVLRSLAEVSLEENSELRSHKIFSLQERLTQLRTSSPSLHRALFDDNELSPLFSVYQSTHASVIDRADTWFSKLQPHYAVLFIEQAKPHPDIARLSAAAFALHSVGQERAEILQIPRYHHQLSAFETAMTSLSLLHQLQTMIDTLAGKNMSQTQLLAAKQSLLDLRHALEELPEDAPFRVLVIAHAEQLSRQLAKIAKKDLMPKLARLWEDLQEVNCHNAGLKFALLNDRIQELEMLEPDLLDEELQFNLNFCHRQLAAFCQEMTLPQAHVMNDLLAGSRLDLDGLPLIREVLTKYIAIIQLSGDQVRPKRLLEFNNMLLTLYKQFPKEAATLLQEPVFSKVSDPTIASLIAGFSEVNGQRVNKISSLAYIEELVNVVTPENAQLSTYQIITAISVYDSMRGFFERGDELPDKVSLYKTLKVLGTQIDQVRPHAMRFTKAEGQAYVKLCQSEGPQRVEPKDLPMMRHMLARRLLHVHAPSITVRAFESLWAKLDRNAQMDLVADPEFGSLMRGYEMQFYDKVATARRKFLPKALRFAEHQPRIIEMPAMTVEPLRVPKVRSKLPAWKTKPRVTPLRHSPLPPARVKGAERVYWEKPANQFKAVEEAWNAGGKAPSVPWITALNGYIDLVESRSQEDADDYKLAIRGLWERHLGFTEAEGAIEQRVISRSNKPPENSIKVMLGKLVMAIRLTANTATREKIGSRLQCLWRSLPAPLQQSINREPKFRAMLKRFLLAEG